MSSITCGNCRQTHTSAREVAACFQFGTPTPPVQHTWRTEPASQAQKDYIKKLNGGIVPVSLSKGAASQLITDLKRPNSQMNVNVAASAVRSSIQVKLITPLPMLELLKDGRYATRPDSTQQYTFLKVWRPKNGKKKGCLIISTQHSDAYKECIVRWPSGTVSVYDNRPDASLLLVVADPKAAMMNYAREKQHCGSCGKKLTDGRSIWYGIGPECEKSWSELIDAVDDNHGHPYRLGDTHRECLACN